jgi:vacuolar-type H+-ATPase subunit I/STV1
MDIASIIAATKETMGLFKATTELVKGIREGASSGKAESKQLIDASIEALRDKLSQLQNNHLELQEVALSTAQQNVLLMQEKRELEEKLTKFDRFENERDLFQRVTLALNTAAYREKSFSGAADDQPLFCPQCFDNFKKSYLSFQEHAMHTKHLKCTVCGTSVHVPRDDGPVENSIRVQSRFNVFDDY